MFRTGLKHTEGKKYPWEKRTNPLFITLIP